MKKLFVEYGHGLMEANLPDKPMYLYREKQYRILPILKTQKKLQDKPYKIP